MHITVLKTISICIFLTFLLPLKTKNDNITHQNIKNSEECIKMTEVCTYCASSSSTTSSVSDILL